MADDEAAAIRLAKLARQFVLVRPMRSKDQKLGPGAHSRIDELLHASGLQLELQLRSESGRQIDGSSAAMPFSCASSGPPDDAGAEQDDLAVSARAVSVESTGWRHGRTK